MTLFLSESDYRNTARQLLEWAGAGPVGIAQTSPKYLAVTEGREPLGSHNGTSCGELPHWLLFRLGIRSAFINRNEAHGWKPVINIAALAYSAVAKTCQLTDQYKPGDVVYIWERADTTDAHAMCVIEHDPDTHALLVAEYGQPGGHLATHQLHQGTDMAGGKARPAWFCGQRALQKWVPLMDALSYADARGELVAPDLACLAVPDVPPDASGAAS